MFSVLITEYEDDYKHRYDSGVYNDPVKLFSTKEKAELYVINKFRSYLVEHETYQKLNKNDLMFLENCDEIDQRFSILFDILVSGEFVDRRFDYQIEEVVFDEEFEKCTLLYE
jgi:hypothetical protein